MECKYHPDTSASWYCQRCDVPFCMDCMPDTSDTPRCTLCRSYLTPLGISDSIAPFWIKLGHFFVYPLALPLLITSIVASLLFAYFFNPEKVSLISIPFFIFWAVFLTKVMFSVMEYTAYGNLDAPDWKKMMSLENGWMFLKLLAMMLIIGFGLYKLASFSLILTIALALFFVVAYPAMNMILCMDKSMWSALNPARILYVMAAIGGAYWTLFGIMVMFYLTIGFGNDYLLENLPLSIGLPLTQFFSLYVSFAMYHMFGYVIYQYHFELDFSVHRQTLHKNVKSHGKHTSELSHVEAKAERLSTITEAEIFIQEGRYKEAEALLIDALKKDEHHNDIYDLLYKLFALQGKSELMAKLCEKHLGILMAERSGNLMRMHYTNTVKHEPEFIPKDPKVIHQLIKLLNRKDDARQGLKLLNYLKKHHTDYEGLADACFVFGKYLTEKLNKRVEAAKIIRWGINVANDELKSEMQNYVRLLV